MNAQPSTEILGTKLAQKADANQQRLSRTLERSQKAAARRAAADKGRRKTARGKEITALCKEARAAAQKAAGRGERTCNIAGNIGSPKHDRELVEFAAERLAKRGITIKQDSQSCPGGLNCVDQVTPPYTAYFIAVSF